MYRIEQYLEVLKFTGIFALLLIAGEIIFSYLYAWYECRKENKHGLLNEEKKYGL